MFDKDIPFRLEHAQFLILGTLSSFDSGLITIYHKKKLLWGGLSESLICGYQYFILFLLAPTPIQGQYPLDFDISGSFHCTVYIPT